MTAQQTIDREATDQTILPSHAWMLGLVVSDDGSLVPPPAANGPFVGTSLVERPANEQPTCTCPDFCDFDHEAD